MKRTLLPLVVFATLVPVHALAQEDADTGSEDVSCIQVIQPAVDPETNECREFSTPCDVPEGWEPVSSCEGVEEDFEDTQLEDLEGREIEREISVRMQQFSSCDDFKDRMAEIFAKTYQYYPYPRGPVPFVDFAEDDALDFDDEAIETNGADGFGRGGAVSQGVKAEDFSDTNVQVLGVDESERIKTDGEFIYYYNEHAKSVFIARAFPTDRVEIIRSIKIPDSFYNPELYLRNDKLVILASRYSSPRTHNSRIWYDYTNKTAVVVYDVSDISDLKIERYSLVDGSLDRSRVIGDTLYVVSSNYISPVLKNHTRGMSVEDIREAMDEARILPHYADIHRTAEGQTGELKVNNKTLPYSVEIDEAASCDEIEYLLPDDETIEELGFTPRMVTISTIDLSDAQSSIETKAVLGDVSEIYMSLENLYLTTRVYTSTPGDFFCPELARCILPIGGFSTTNTIIHKFSVDELEVDYEASAFVAGAPLNQYSMNERNGNFQIITSVWHPERATHLFVLDENLEKIGSVTDIAPGEEFKSSRYIGDKLYLVTFRAIDPLFVIDIADPSDPEIIGELKIPGFSTYLHPYDDNHLIGLGYDTMENQWGGTQTAGVQVSLYEIDYTRSETAESRCGALQ